MSKESLSELEHNFNLLQRQIPTRDLRVVANEELKMKEEEQRISDMRAIIKSNKSRIPSFYKSDKTPLSKKEKVIKFGAGIVVVGASNGIMNRLGIHATLEQIALQTPFVIATLVNVENAIKKRRFRRHLKSSHTS